MSYRVVAHGSNAEVVYRGREIHGSFGAAQREAEAVARSRRGLADVHVIKDGKIVWETGAVRKNPSYFVDVIDARTGHVIESRVRRADASATIAYYRMTGNKHLKMRPVPKPPRTGTSRSTPRRNPDIVLRRLPANSAWAFVFGDAVIRLHDDLPMFFPTRKEAVAEAKSYGFTVRTNGRVSVRRS